MSASIRQKTTSSISKIGQLVNWSDFAIEQLMFLLLIPMEAFTSISYRVCVHKPGTNPVILQEAFDFRHIFKVGFVGFCWFIINSH